MSILLPFHNTVERKLPQLTCPWLLLAFDLELAQDPSSVSICCPPFCTQVLSLNGPKPGLVFIFAATGSVMSAHPWMPQLRDQEGAALPCPRFRARRVQNWSLNLVPNTCQNSLGSYFMSS